MSRDPAWREAVRRAVVARQLDLEPSAVGVLAMSPSDLRVLDDLIGDALAWRKELTGGD